MSFDNNGIDIAKNIKIIEWLKSELLSSLASLFELLVKGIKGRQEAIGDILANIILVTYVLARRLGMSYSNLDMRVNDKIKLGVLEDHKIESWFGDLSELKKHMDRSSKK
ncbi:MazG-like family protein [Maledivibacter halophilus]|uniref:MazG-like family protein n=1 Tax=Maledivibacter halophilus TaxID=36842 RepID=A0A1T5MJC3_9FIRM|nr:MazG-like family protein [Maledivibacter halophilus]SKC88316.1 MazG-like family protein [Maledivibacter halophilus]